MTSADNEIRVVIRVLKWIGWPLTCFFGAAAILCAIAFPITIFSALPKDPSKVPTFILSGIAAIVLLLGIAYGFHGYVRLARKLQDRKPDVAKTVSQSLIPMMVLGFPIFTVIGFVVQQKIRLHYPVHLQSETHGSSSVAAEYGSI